MKVVTICPKFFPGVLSVFRNLQKVITSVHYFPEEILNEFNVDCDLIIFGAWHNDYARILPLIKCKKAL